MAHVRDWRDMARGISTVLLILLLVQDNLTRVGVSAAPTAKKNDILAGTEFLSVFINGAMATPPPTPSSITRRRGYRRGGQQQHVISNHPGDSVVAESRHEASIYRIRANNPNVRPITIRQNLNDNGGKNEQVVRFYPVSHGNKSETTSKSKNSTNVVDNNRQQKVIGVSVTSTVEATPYKVRIEHNDENINETSTMTTPVPARLVTEELNNIVSESNRSEFTVEEGYSSTIWKNENRITPRPKLKNPVTEPIEQNYELPEENSEIRETIDYMEPIVESSETRLQQPQGRKVGRHYDTSHYNRQEHDDTEESPSSIKIYSEPAKIYGEPSKVYGEPSKIYGEPSRVYGEPSRVYSEPEKIYSEPSKIYSEPAKVYGEPAKIYSEPSKIYGVPSRVYDNDGNPIVGNVHKVTSTTSKSTSTVSHFDRPTHNRHHHRHDHREPEEQNYEIDESVSVGSNGNVHGPQTSVTEQPHGPSHSELDDDNGHKVSYVVEGRNYRKYRIEERTPDGFIVGEYGVVSHDDGTLRGVRYTADGTINPRLIYDALMKFLAL